MNLDAFYLSFSSTESLLRFMQRLGPALLIYYIAIYLQQLGDVEHRLRQSDLMKRTFMILWKRHRPTYV